MTDQHRYFKACALYNEAVNTYAKITRLERLKAWAEHLREAARRTAPTPFNIADLFTTFSNN